MQDFDPSTFQEGFIPPHLKQKKEHDSPWHQNDWLANHPDKRAFHRMGKRPFPKNNCRDIRKKKFRVNPSMTVEKFLAEVNPIVQPQIGKELVYYVNGEPLTGMADQTMYNVYDQYKDEDGFIYVTYAAQGVDMTGDRNHIGMYKRTHITSRRIQAANEALGANKIPCIVERMDRPLPPFDPTQCDACDEAHLPFGFKQYMQKMGLAAPGGEHNHPNNHDHGEEEPQQHATRDIDLSGGQQEDEFRELGEEDAAPAQEAAAPEGDEFDEL
ncbi:hypothetical protein AGDE_16737 [Angomonas deanei]|uniref:Autophagy protein Atg8 ubiquitin like, putative n=1 Tax=Angomonas deanei TaxID=59799 RepID=A0A7G2C3V2_9TRYP|nr:hypothetical protein AGDE_16737 [Angomonas deanei]CAD2213954.1 Autophagy protein Atg8 ubiquitin like, putative [Angomonas deanei]|eukprot:EPY16310.1 hypothetical protein AGDE_16737 [Angomonas deanei]